MDEEFEIVGYEPPMDEEFEVVGFEPVEPPSVAEQSTPAYPDDTWGKQARRLAAGAFAIPLQGFSSINRGVGGLVQGAGELSGIDAISDFGETLKGNSRMFDALLRDNTGIQPGTWEDTALSVGGEVAASLATMGGGIATGAGKLASAAAPLVYQLGQRYSDLRDRGATPGQAALGTGLSAPLNVGLNMLDVGAIMKTPGASNLLTEYAKRAATIGGVNAATNVAGVYGDAFIDKQFADTPLTPEELAQRVKVGAATGLASGPAFGAMGLRRGSPGVDAADLIDTINVDGAKRIADIEAPVPTVDDIDIPAKTSLPADPVEIQRPYGPELAPPGYEVRKGNIVAPEAYTGARSDQEIRDAINLREGAIGLENPILKADGTPVDAPPPPAQPKVYRPITSKGTPRQDLQPNERAIVDYVVGSKDYNAAKKAAEEAEGIAAEVKAQESTRGPSNIEKRGIIVTEETKSFPKPLDFNPPKPDDELVIQVQPKPGEAIELPYEPISLIDTDITQKGFARALEERAAKQAGLVDANGIPRLSSEAGATNIFGVAAEDAINFFKALPGRIAHPLRTIDEIGSRLTGSLPEGYKSQPDVYNKYANKGLAGRWARTIEWMDTMKREVPESGGYVQSVWEAPNESHAQVWDATQTMTKYLQLGDDEMKLANEYLRAIRRKTEMDGSFQFTRENLEKMGVTPRVADAMLTVNKTMRAQNELNRGIAIEKVRLAYGIRRMKAHFQNDLAMQKKLASLDPDADAAEEAMLASVDSLDKRLEILRQNEDKKLAEVTEKFNKMAEANYVPFTRYGEHVVKSRAPDGEYVSRQFESKKEMNRYIALAKKSGHTEIESGQLAKSHLSKYDGVPAEFLEMMGESMDDRMKEGFSKHFLKAHLVRGENVDLRRNLADYVTQGAKFRAINQMEIKTTKELLTNLADPKFAPAVAKLQAWKEEIMKPSGWSALGNIMNLNYISLNLRTSAADQIGRIQTVWPYMAKYVGNKAEYHFLNAAKKEFQWHTGKLDPESELAKAIGQAERRGVFPSGRGPITLAKDVFKIPRRMTPKDMERLRRGGSGLGATIHDGLFALKFLSERSVDLSTFIGGWEMYPQAMPKLKKLYGDNVPSRAEFAESFVREVRAVPHQVELPPMYKNFREVLRYRLYQGKIMKLWLEALKDRETGVAVRMALAAPATVGIKGLPFVTMGLVAAKAAGYEPESWLIDNLPETASDLALFGPVSVATGVDFSNVASFGEPIPGIGTDFKTAAAKTAMGVLFSPFERTDRMLELADKDMYAKAIASSPIMLQPVTNALEAFDISRYGVRNKDGFAPVPLDKVDGSLIAKRAVGFTDLRTSKAQMKAGIARRAAVKDPQHYYQRIGSELARDNLEGAMAVEEEAAMAGVELSDKSVEEAYLKAMGDLDVLLSKVPEEKLEAVMRRMERINP